MVRAVVAVAIHTGLKRLAEEVFSPAPRAAEEEQAAAIAPLVHGGVVRRRPQLLRHESRFVEDDEEVVSAITADLALRGRERDDFRAVGEAESA
jgi:hypothetical protein